ncbi:MAG: CpsD/CapB family tyrosine-protein kinase, partial [Gemmataceae bacterium]|nr:CpsD/CapB family tyrosine-protein kinase [Gemmataceae bacterium]
RNSDKLAEARAEEDEARRNVETVRAKRLEALDGPRRLARAAPVADELGRVANLVVQAEARLKRAKEELAAEERRFLEMLPLPAPKNGGTLPARFDAGYSVSDSDLQVNDSVFRQLLLKYHLTKLEVEAPDRVSILQAGSQPTQKDTKKQVLGTVVAGLMGFVVMAAGVVGFEMMARRVSSLGDVRGTTPAAVVGVIPCGPNDTSPGAAGGRDPLKRAATNEAVDKLRAYVSQTWISRGATTIGLTSPIGDEGKAFTAFGLASSLAQAGYRTLVVDFDLREPALHAYAGVPNAAGVCELLRAETDARSVLQVLPSGLHLLPAGKWSDEARKAATGEKLEALLARLKEPYDCVVIHGHALLTVAESVEVARRCEVVLVCARYRETVTPLLKRAADRVAAMEIPYSGVVYVGATEQEALC